MLTLLNSADGDFNRQLTRLLTRDDAQAVDATVAEIIQAVRDDGDAALMSLTAKYDSHTVTDAAALELPPVQMENALAKLKTTAPKVARALRTAARRIKDFHRHELQKSWQVTDADGHKLGQRITAVQRVGVYVPGGKAAYPSSVLMNVIPARLAGVDEIVMATPAVGGVVNPTVLAAAALAGVDRVFAIGGAQAIAALAFGTVSVPAVDKIVGPGNSYVAAAKRQVFGKVGIDNIAGPSEVVVVCDRFADAEWVAMDLFAQAEHDERAQAIAVTDSGAMCDAINRAVAKLLPQMQRREIITRALADNGALIKVADLNAAAEVCNRIAPEHLELMINNPRRLLKKIRNAGAIFIGKHSAESIGDYCAGPNHVLPTAGSARFASPLGVGDFQKRSSIIEINARAADKLATVAATLARSEGLDAHARSAEYRMRGRTRRGKVRNE